MLLLVALISIALLFCLSIHPVHCNLTIERQATVPLRGLLAVCIVLHHYVIICGLHGIPILGQLSEWGVPIVALFFFLSGYGLMASWQKKGDTYFSGFLISRFQKLLPALIVVSALGILSKFVLGRWSFEEFCIDIFTGTPPSPNSWFVYVLLIYYIVLDLSVRGVRNIKYVVALLWLFSILYCLSIDAIGWPDHWKDSVFAFNIGLMMPLFEQKWKTINPNNLQKIYWVLFISSLVAMVTVWLSPTPLLTLLISNFFIPIVVFFVLHISNISGRVLTWIGGISYEVYLIHGFFLSAWFGGFWPWDRFSFALFLFVATLLSAWCLHSFIERLHFIKK